MRGNEREATRKRGNARYLETPPGIFWWIFLLATARISREDFIEVIVVCVSLIDGKQKHGQ